MTDTKIVGIEGGRAIQSRFVHERLASDVAAAHKGMPTLSGYVLVTWDDEGYVTGSYQLGQRNPYSPPLVAQIVDEKVKALIRG